MVYILTLCFIFTVFNFTFVYLYVNKLYTDYDEIFGEMSTVGVIWITIWIQEFLKDFLSLYHKQYWWLAFGQGIQSLCTFV